MDRIDAILSGKYNESYRDLEALGIIWHAIHDAIKGTVTNLNDDDLIRERLERALHEVVALQERAKINYEEDGVNE